VEWGGSVCCIGAGVACVCAWVLGVWVWWEGGGGSVFVLMCSRAHQAGASRAHQAGVGWGVGRSSGGPPHPTRRAAPHLPPEAPRPRPRQGAELRGASGVLGLRGAPAALVQLLSGRRGAGRRRGPLLGLGLG